MPVEVLSMEGLRSFVRHHIEYLEDAANHRHRCCRLSADACALTREERPVGLAPIFKRAVAFALYGRIFCRDLVVWDNFNTGDASDECGFLPMINDDLDLTNLRDGFLLSVHRPQKAGSGPFAASSDERQKRGR